MNQIIETQNLTRFFGRQEVVRNLTFEVPTGSIYAFLGPNGAGKTTTIKMLMNILQPSGGSARIMGVDSKDLGPTQLAQIGYVSENQELPEWMTVRQFIDYCSPMYPTWDQAFCNKLLKDFDLPLDKKLSSLSRGTKVKASLVTSLAYRPKLVVLDEPFTGLDALVRDEFIRGLLELSEQSDWTIFVSSHDIDEVDRLADWVGIINEGHLHLSEPTESLQARFRLVMFTLGEEMSQLPSDLPTSWLVPELTGRSVRFVESEYGDAKTRCEIRQIFPSAQEAAITQMSLRDIFLTLARTFRFKTDSSKS